MKLIELKEKWDFKALMKNKIPLTPEEKKKAMDAGCVWHLGPNGEETCAIWKSKDSKGKVVYGCNTHRAGAVKPTLKGAINAYKFVESTS